MSSFYDWSKLPAAIQESITLNHERCGCHERPRDGLHDRWWLCEYHVGMMDGWEAAEEAFSAYTLETSIETLTALCWCLAGWMTPGVGVGYQDLANVFEAYVGQPPPKWVRP